MVTRRAVNKLPIPNKAKPTRVITARPICSSRGGRTASSIDSETSASTAALSVDVSPAAAAGVSQRACTPKSSLFNVIERNGAAPAGSAAAVGQVCCAKPFANAGGRLVSAALQGAVIDGRVDRVRFRADKLRNSVARRASSGKPISTQPTTTGALIGTITN